MPRAARRGRGGGEGARVWREGNRGKDQTQRTGFTTLDSLTFRIVRQQHRTVRQQHRQQHYFSLHQLLQPAQRTAAAALVTAHCSCQQQRRRCIPVISLSSSSPSACMLRCNPNRPTLARVHHTTPPPAPAPARCAPCCDRPRSRSPRRADALIISVAICTAIPRPRSGPARPGRAAFLAARRFQRQRRLVAHSSAVLIPSHELSAPPPPLGLRRRSGHPVGALRRRRTHPIASPPFTRAPLTPRRLLSRLQEEARVVVLRFGHDWDETCMQMDEILASTSDKMKNFAVVYLVDISEVPDFNAMYELYDPCTVMFFFRNKVRARARGAAAAAGGGGQRRRRPSSQHQTQRKLPCGSVKARGPMTVPLPQPGAPPGRRRRTVGARLAKTARPPPRRARPPRALRCLTAGTPPQHLSSSSSPLRASCRCTPPPSPSLLPPPSSLVLPLA